MKRKEFFSMLKNNQGKNIALQVEENTIERTEMKKYMYYMINDRIHIRNSENLDFVVINVNLIRSIRENIECINLILDNKEETQIKISIT